MSTSTMSRQRAIIRAVAANPVTPVIYDPKLGRVRALTKAERRLAERRNRR